MYFDEEIPHTRISIVSECTRVNDEKMSKEKLKFKTVF